MKEVSIWTIWTVAKFWLPNVKMNTQANKIEFKKFPQTKGNVKFRESLLRELFYVAKLETILLVLLNLISFFSPLIFIYVISQIIQGNIYYRNNDSAIIVAILCVLFKYLSSMASLFTEIKISKLICFKYMGMILNSQNSVSIDKKLKVSSFDLNIILDNLSPAIQFYTSPLLILFISIYFFLSEGLLGLFVIILVFIFIPITLLLSKKSNQNYQRVMDLTSTRIENFKSWLRYAPYKLQLGMVDAELKEHSEIAKREVKWRNFDTIIRGIDGYIIAFGRIIPFAILMFLDYIHPNSGVYTSFIWFSIPILQVILSIPSSYTYNKAANKSIQEINIVLRQAYIDKVGANNNESLVLDVDWPIWRGQLKALVPDLEHVEKSFLIDLLSAARLIPEFGESIDAALEKIIDLDGKNISKGQLLRLQIFRGCVLAYLNNQKLYIDNEFFSLDMMVKENLLEFLNNNKYIEISITKN